MAAKVIRSIKKFSSRKLDVGGSFGFTTTPPESPRTSPKIIVEKGEKEGIRTSAKISKKSCKGKEREPKGKGKEREPKGKPTKKNNTKNKDKELQQEKRHRRVRRNKPDTEEDQVGRENDDDSQSQGLMEQAEYVESSSTTNDYVGGYDFGNPSIEAEDTQTTGAFACLTPEEIVQIRKKQIQETAEILKISASNASNLLYHYQWNTEILHQRYWTSPEEGMKEAGLVCASPDADDEAMLLGSGECLVCCETVEGGDCCALKCHHRFCLDCWSSYLTVKIKEGEVTRINCPALNCKYTVPDPVVQKLVGKEIYEKYLRFVTKSFVEDNAQITWCPSPRCGNAITTDMVNEKIVECSCGFRFCFSCHHEAHAPATCEQVKLWLQKCSDDSETGHWVGANTKDCPRCGVFVEKNGGCNHMTCRQCGNEWCWLCLKQWKGHSDYYACVRYEKAQKKKAEKEKKKPKKQSKQEQQEAEREEKRQALERYLTYYTKYLDYDSKSKNSQTIRERSKNRIQILQSEQSTLAEVKFIEIATETLLECYGVLKFSFVGSYYLGENTKEKQIFMFLQEELEKTVLDLAEILDSVGILQKRTQCVDMTKFTQTRKDNLLCAVENWLEGGPGVVSETGF